MADETFGIGVAVALQSAYGTFDSTLDTDADAGGTIEATEGSVLGDKDSGDAESGITIPTFTRVGRDVADVASSFTPQPNSFERNDAAGMAIAFQAQGNGATATTPANDEAKPDAGIDALFEGSGLVGATGTAPVYEYIPRDGGDTPAFTRYLSIVLWVGTHRWKFQDCVVETLTLDNPPGQVGLFNAAIRIGEIYEFADGVTLPAFTYGLQASTSAPRVVSAPATYSTSKGFGSFQLGIANGIEEIPDSNAAQGFRLDQTSRRFELASQLYLDAADSDLEYQEVIRATGTPASWSHQVGTAAGASDVINAYKVEINEVQLDSAKYDRAGTVVVADITGHGTNGTAAGEFKLSMN